MEKELVMVTAFIDIKRDEFNVYPRSKKKYFEYFKFWAGIKNKLIVFCTEEDGKVISNIRNEAGCDSENTVIISTVDIWKVEPSIYAWMQMIELDSSFKESRLHSIACSNMAKYDYVMLMKYYFLKVAAELPILNNTEELAWIDFGFNHGGEYYLEPEEFKFTWIWEFKKDIELFALSKPEQMSVIDSLQFQQDCIQGTIVGCKKERAKDLYDWMLEAMYALLRCGFIDDDQHLLLMMYKEHRDTCHYVEGGWFSQFESICNQEFTTIGKTLGRGYISKRDGKEWLNRCIERINTYQ